MISARAGSEPSRSGRGPGISDLLILIAATAAAMGLLRVVMPWQGAGFDTPGKILADLKVRGPYPVHVNFWAHLASPFLFSWTLALITIRLRRPRPTWRRLVRQPGAVACLTAAGAMLGNLAAWGLLAIPRLFGSAIVSRSLIGVFYPVEFRAYVFAQTTVGYAIASAWLLLAASRRWRGEPSWIDRSGRFLGFVWIATIPLNQWTTLLIQ